jgi:hypothetical protein
MLPLPPGNITEETLPMSYHIPPAVTIHGTLKHYAETGMAGGYWACIDDRFNHLPSNDRFCPKCGALWPESAPEPDDQTLDQSRQEMAAKLGFPYVPPCKNGEHDWRLEFPQGKWSFNGFHFLKSHDHLVIQAPQAPHPVIWEEEIVLPAHEYAMRAERDFSARTKVANVEYDTWRRWFIDDCPATLTTHYPEPDQLY